MEGAGAQLRNKAQLAARRAQDPQDGRVPNMRGRGANAPGVRRRTAGPFPNWLIFSVPAWYTRPVRVALRECLVCSGTRADGRPRAATGRRAR